MARQTLILENEEIQKYELLLNSFDEEVDKKVEEKAEIMYEIKKDKVYAIALLFGFLFAILVFIVLKALFIDILGCPIC